MKEKIEKEDKIDNGVKKTPVKKDFVKKEVEEKEEPFNCLRNEIIIVHHVPKESALVHNPKHINYGGMSIDAARWLTIPRQRNGQLVDILTKNEKAFLEEVMGLDFNALSIYKKKDNYWSNYLVKLRKQDNFLDLSVPEDYIKYKVLLANTDIIAPSLDALQEKPKATYEFVILHKNEEAKAARKKVNYTIESYKMLGKIGEDADKLRIILETATGKPYAAKTSIDEYDNDIDKLIKADSKLFLKIASDELLDTKILLRKAVECGIVNLRNGLFFTEQGHPMCEKGNATLSVAAQYLNLAKNQELKLSLETRVENKKE